MEHIKLSQKALNKAKEFIENGGVVIFPTDTVYGFLADAGNKKAVLEIYKIKKRAKLKPLAVFVKDFKMAKELAEIDEPTSTKGLGEAKQKKILKKNWPGKVTFILVRKKNIKLYDGGKETIALRIPKHKFLNILLKKMNRPLVQTSANISGSPTLVKVSDIINQFGKQDILLIDAGNLKKAKSSQIYDFTSGDLTRLR